MAGKYLYAIVAGNQITLPESAGIEDQALEILGTEHLAIVVSETNATQLRPQRKHLARHQEVLAGLLKQGATPLPMKFGMIADSAGSVERLLEANAATLQTQLDRVVGQVEMGLRVVLEVPNVFEFFVGKYETLGKLRDQFFNDRQPNQDEMIHLGREFEKALTSERERALEQVEQRLRPHCTQIQSNDCRDEREIVHVACLIPREAESQFEQWVIEAARPFDQNYTFDFNGPWCPHNFVQLDLEAPTG